MSFINNDPKQIEIRKSQNTLIVVGSGTVLFSIWTLAKMIGRLFILRDETVAGVRAIGGDTLSQYSDSEVFVPVAIITLLFLLLILAVRLYVGLSALSEGRSLKRHLFYVPAAAIMVILNVAALVASIRNPDNSMSYGALSADTTFSGIIIDLTSIIMLAEMVRAAVRIRRLTGVRGKAGDR